MITVLPERIILDPDDLTNPAWNDPRNYLDMIVEGHIVAGKYVRRMAECLLESHDNPPESCWYDQEAAEKYLNFFGYLRHVRGELRGDRILWQPWHKAILAELYGWKREFHGREIQRFRTLTVEVGRKGSKTTMSEGILIHRLLFSYDGAEIYGLATSHKQAGYAFGIGKEMVSSIWGDINAARGLHINNAIHRMSHQKGNFYQVLSPKKNTDKKTNDAYNPAVVLFDEAASIQDRATFEYMTTGMGARMNHLKIFITTDTEHLDTYYAEHKAVLKKKLDKRQWDKMPYDLAFFYGLDKDEEKKIDEDESLWVKPMPHIGHSVPFEFIRQELEDSKEIPSRRRTLLIKYFNFPAPANEAWMPVDKLQANQVLPGTDLQKTGPCMVGIDLGLKHDFSAVTIMWEPIRDQFSWLYHAWIPRSRMEQLPEEVFLLLERAAKEGWLTITDTEAIDYEEIIDFLEWVELWHDPDLYCFDPYHMLNLITAARKRKTFVHIFDEEQPEYMCKARSVRQSHASLSGPVKRLEVAIVNGRAEHQGSEFIDWQFTNTLLEWDKNDELCKLGKDRDQAVFIDDFSALTNCMAGNTMFHLTKAEEELNEEERRRRERLRKQQVMDIKEAVRQKVTGKKKVADANDDSDEPEEPEEPSESGEYVDPYEQEASA